VITLRSKNEKETIRLGEIIGANLEAGDVVCLDGQLGTGKTVIAKAIAVSLGVDEYVTSPSYTIINEYNGKLPVYHFDVYRIDDIDEMYELGYEEYFFGAGVCIIEWASMIEELLPENCLFVKLKQSEDFNHREFEISGKEETVLKIKEAFQC